MSVSHSDLQPVSQTPSSSPFATLSQRAFSEQMSQAPSLEAPSEAAGQASLIAEPHIPALAASEPSSPEAHMQPAEHHTQPQSVPEQEPLAVSTPEQHMEQQQHHRQRTSTDELADRYLQQREQGWQPQPPPVQEQQQQQQDRQPPPQHQLYSEVSEIPDLDLPPPQLQPSIPNVGRFVPLSQVRA